MLSNQRTDSQMQTQFIIGNSRNNSHNKRNDSNILSDSDTDRDEFLDTVDGDDFDNDDDAFVNRVNHKWGAEETELR